MKWCYPVCGLAGLQGGRWSLQIERATPLTSICVSTAEDVCEIAHDSFSFVAMKSKSLIHQAALPAVMLIPVGVRDLHARILHGGPIPDAEGLRTDGYSFVLIRATSLVVVAV